MLNVRHGKANVKKIKDRGMIGVMDTQCPIEQPKFVLFQDKYLKTAFRLFQFNKAKQTHFTEPNCNTESAL